MIEKILVMAFKTADDKSFTLKVKDIVDEPNEATLAEIMDLIIDNGIFTVSGVPVSKKVKCEIVSTETTSFEI